MNITEKTPARVTKISLFFSLINFLISGITLSSITLFVIFTLSVYSTAHIFLTISQVEHSTDADKRNFYIHVLIVGLAFVGIATFSYSAIFGIFYAAVVAVYIISPNDREWLAGKKRLTFVNNKVEYQDV